MLKEGSKAIQVNSHKRRFLRCYTLSFSNDKTQDEGGLYAESAAKSTYKEIYTLRFSTEMVKERSSLIVRKREQERMFVSRNLCS